MYAAGVARAWLENLSASRRRGALPRALGQEALESELDKVMARNGKTYLKAIRQEANAIAPQLELEEKARKLDAVVGALCATRPYSGILKSDRAIARANREPFDAHIGRC